MEQKELEYKSQRCRSPSPFWCRWGPCTAQSSLGHRASWRQSLDWDGGLGASH